MNKIFTPAFITIGLLLALTLWGFNYPSKFSSWHEFLFQIYSGILAGFGCAGVGLYFYIRMEAREMNKKLEAQYVETLKILRNKYCSSSDDNPWREGR